jgi:hypothetical protein
MELHISGRFSLKVKTIYPLGKRMCGVQGWSRRSEGEKRNSPFPGIEFQPLDCPTCRLVTNLTELSGLTDTKVDMKDRMEEESEKKR